jgi:hypothetical protein
MSLRDTTGLPGTSEFQLFWNGHQMEGWVYIRVDRKSRSFGTGWKERRKAEHMMSLRDTTGLPGISEIPFVEYTGKSRYCATGKICIYHKEEQRSSEKSVVVDIESVSV